MAKNKAGGGINSRVNVRPPARQGQPAHARNVKGFARFGEGDASWRGSGRYRGRKGLDQQSATGAPAAAG
jgi:hypothetical protein